MFNIETEITRANSAYRALNGDRMNLAQYQGAVNAAARADMAKEAAERNAETEMRGDSKLLTSYADETLLERFLAVMQRHAGGAINVHRAITELHAVREDAIREASKSYAHAVHESARSAESEHGDDGIDFISEL